MSLRVAQMDTDDAHTWDRLVASFEGTTVFHTSAWLSVLEKTFGHRRLLLRFEEKDGRCVAVLPLVVARKAVFKIAASPLRGTTGIMGPLSSGAGTADIADALDRYGKEKGFDYVELTFTSETDSGAWSRLGYEHEFKETYKLYLPGDEAGAWGALESKCRNMVRKAEKSGVSIVEGDAKDLDGYYAMLCESFGKSGIKPTTTKEFIKNVYEGLAPRGMLKLLFAEYGGKKVSGGIFLHGMDGVYFWSGAALTEYNKVAPNNLLQWHVIRWACNNGYRTYDMAGKGIARIDHFKQSFGPRIERYSYVWKANNVCARIGRNLYKKLMFSLRKKGRARQ